MLLAAYGCPADLVAHAYCGALVAMDLHASRKRVDAVEKIGLGGGCHWCTEAIFQMLAGVGQVEQGFIRSDPPSDSWAEGVIVHFDPCVIGLPTLVEVHLRTHRATAPFVARSKYRSAIYVEDDDQRKRATDAMISLQHEFGHAIQTRVLALQAFRLSDKRVRNYYASDPGRPFCRRYIDPKLDMIRRDFAAIIASPEDSAGA
jgi:peptide-methionine (S)-S-oxide reductase